MSTGRPDYFRGVDITYQSLGEITNRPKYGGALESLGGVAVDANAVTSLVTISGKGMIYGGIIFVVYEPLQKTGVPRLKIDGNLVTDTSIDTLMLLSVVETQSYPLYLLKYDTTNGIYSLAASYGITFETELELLYKEQEGETPTVFFHLIYALI